jgi:Transcriptional regulator, AbiEi antitoxin, Type IV TA system
MIRQFALPTRSSVCSCFFADRHQHAWLKRLKKYEIDLGKGKRMLVKGGKFDAAYQITVPEHLDGVR